MKWILIKQMPEFDGDYLCHIVKTEFCGAFKKYQKVLRCDHNKFITDESERVTHWMNLPNEPNRTVTLNQQDDKHEHQFIDKFGVYECQICGMEGDIVNQQEEQK